MPIRTLNARFVATVRPTPGKRVEYCDTEVPGLALRVTPTAGYIALRHERLNGLKHLRKPFSKLQRDMLTGLAGPRNEDLHLAGLPCA